MADDTATFILKGIQFGDPCEKPCDSLDEAVSLACSWSDPSEDYPDGFAFPVCIVNANGDVVMGRDALHAAMAERGY